MKSKPIFKIPLDLSMSVIMLFLMAYHLTGGAAHEWLGVTMFVLFIIHNILKQNWYRSLLKGKYTPFRIIQTLINLLVFASMSCLIISGVIMSGHVFTFLNISGGMSFARVMHFAASHWGFILMFMHLGLHWGMFIGMFRKVLKISTASPVRTIILRIITIVIAIYGIYVFIKYDFISYLFLQNLFVFFDYDQPLILFLLDYISMIGLFVFVGYYLTKLLQKLEYRQSHCGKTRR